MLRSGVTDVIAGAVGHMSLDQISTLSSMESALGAVGGRAALDSLHFRIAGDDQRNVDRRRKSSVTKCRQKCFMVAGEHDRTCRIVSAADSACPAIAGMGAVPELHVGGSVHLEIYRACLVAGNSCRLAGVSCLPISGTNSA